VGVVLTYAKRPLQSHPIVPSAQFGVATGNTAWTADGMPDTALASGVDLLLSGGGSGGDDQAQASSWARQLMALVLGVASGEVVPVAEQVGNVDFQLSRGFTGISL
jgi:hypothetical protein